jgi:hypothetical protein
MLTSMFGLRKPKQTFQRVLFHDGLVFDGKSYRTATTCLAIQLLTGIFRREFKFGVPKDSDLEPDYWLVKGNRNRRSKRDLISLRFWHVDN